jgi:hypothetical protein
MLKKDRFSMGDYLRPPDDVYWRFRRLPPAKQVGAECTSWEDGFTYRVRGDRVICRVVDGIEVETIDSIPFTPPAGARIMTGVRWGFRMPISTFYQQIIGRSGAGQGNRDSEAEEALRPR